VSLASRGNIWTIGTDLTSQVESSLGTPGLSTLNADGRLFLTRVVSTHAKVVWVSMFGKTRQ
jgi:hypothetical protein